jgi:two-component system phosphate regulon response regulator PhoB
MTLDSMRPALEPRDTKAKRTILVVDDDRRVVDLLQISLSQNGYHVTTASTGEEGLDQVRRETPDLIILDLRLPKKNGYEVCAALKSAKETAGIPIIMVSATAEVDARLQGLMHGADDYLTKPFSANELLARIRALLRRRAPDALDASVEVGTLMINPATRRVMSKGREVKIGATEFKLLHFLMTHAERVHSRTQLLDRVWGDHVFIEERTVDVHVKRLREALSQVACQHMIETVRGVGYRLANPLVVPV